MALKMCALAAVALLSVVSAARAEVVNLECRRPNHQPDHPHIVVWVDFDNRTVTHTNIHNQQIHLPVNTAPAQISPVAIGFTMSMGSVTIDRITGVGTWPGVRAPQHYNCTPGTVPFPARRF